MEEETSYIKKATSSARRELHPGQLFVIKEAIALGGTLISEHPEIAELYREGKTYQEIAETLDISSRYQKSEDVITQGIGWALRGFNGMYGNHPPYEGLISDVGEQEKLKKEHQRRGFLSRGFTSWSEVEEENAYQLSQNQAYQWDKGRFRGMADAALIALELNIQYHDCNEVRSAGAVGQKIRKFRKSLEERLEEE